MLSRFCSNCLVVATLGCILGSPFAFAQSTMPNTTAAPKSAIETARERRKALEQDAADRQKRIQVSEQAHLEAVRALARKRADCRKQAREQSLRYAARYRFVKKCMSS